MVYFQQRHLAYEGPIVVRPQEYEEPLQQRASFLLNMQSQSFVVISIDMSDLEVLRDNSPVSGIEALPCYALMQPPFHLKPFLITEHAIDTMTPFCTTQIDHLPKRETNTQDFINPLHDH
jgi:hypothetical protein